MPTSLDTLVKETRRFIRDWPAPVDALTASITSSATTLTISDTTQLQVNWPVEIDYETMLVRSISTSTTFTVMRGWAGSTSASHASSATVLVKPAFSATEIIDALNAAKDEMYPMVYKRVIDTSLSASNMDVYEYNVPNMPGTYNGDTVPIPYIWLIEVLAPADYAYREWKAWYIRRGATPFIKFRRVPWVGSTIRVHGFGPFPDLSASADTLDAQWPTNAVRPLVLCAASRLLGSGEAGRTRQVSGAVDAREQANRPGNAISLANQLERRFEKDLLRAAMPPMPPHIIPSF